MLTSPAAVAGPKRPCTTPSPPHPPAAPPAAPPPTPTRSPRPRPRRPAPHPPPAAQPPGGRRGVALHHQIEVARLAPEQRVAHRAADDPDAGKVGQRREQRRGPGQGAQPVEQVVGAHTATIAAHVVAG